ncbi:aldo/keto reductase [Streptomyces johnsoniae]|uniref:Aldo/keto reductase n=1 Tax=Streptomyces johnsoniae TaxID=3075532 RepID=A0ABU2S381_9ACTN|nr:aldo/keto reductase [Streptomyces sp. DSM 41886]MDT0443456.1 aldo/keto reductase [Streptomyces sp. DSM 41886]
MEYRRLGASGCAVSAFALGTMTFGAATDKEESFAQLDTFVEAGGSLIDTADVYVGGTSEEIIGQWFADRPAEITNRVVLATKGRFATDRNDPNGVGASRRHLDRALTASLRRLGLETIDLYQVHAWDPLTPLEETLSFLDDVIRAGKIRYYGLSNFTGWQVQKAVDLAGSLGLAKPVTLQPQYNLLSREIEWEIVPACRHNGLGLLPWSPLASGILTGKYQRDTEPAADQRLSHAETARLFGGRRGEQRTWDVIDVLKAVAERRGATVSQVALAWVAAQPAVTAVILGARTIEQLKDNLGASGLVLSGEEAEQLGTASQPSVDYPYGGMALRQRRRKIEGGWHHD